jgi:hypothetical protein
MEVLLLLVIIALAVWAIVRVIASISKNKKDKAPTYVDPFYRPGSFRGELGSPGTSPKIVGKHSVNCECMICLHGHDPDNGLSCQCAACQGYRLGKPLY